MPSPDKSSTPDLCAKLHGFTLHAAVRWGADQCKELEELCRYITRPAIANERLKRNRASQVVLQLKSAFKDGPTHIVMSPLEVMQRLAAKGFRSRRNLTGNQTIVLMRQLPVKSLQAEEAPKSPNIPSFDPSEPQNEKIKLRAIARKRNSFGKGLGDILLEEG